MILADLDGPRCLWRVGYYADPLGFVAPALCQWSHRFDDSARRFRTVYIAEMGETALREVLADFRPNAAAIAAYLAAFPGDAAASWVPGLPVTAVWRAQNVLASCHLDFDGPICDLTNAAQRFDLEHRHAQLLADHGLDHLDLHEITTSRRVVTQTIAADVYDRLDAAAIRFPSRLDGNACYAVFEGRGRVTPAANPIDLGDPAPAQLQSVSAGWNLALEDCPHAALGTLRS